jgi:hypothetical protein
VEVFYFSSFRSFRSITSFVCGKHISYYEILGTSSFLGLARTSVYQIISLDLDLTLKWSKMMLVTSGQQLFLRVIVVPL